MHYQGVLFHHTLHLIVKYELSKKDRFPATGPYRGGYWYNINFTVTQKAQYFCSLTAFDAQGTGTNYAYFLKNGEQFGFFDNRDLTNDCILMEYSSWPDPSQPNYQQGILRIWRVDLSPGDVITCPQSDQYPTNAVFFTL